MLGDGSSERQPKKQITRSFVAITVLFVLILIVFSFDIHDSRKNSARDGRLLKATVALSKANAILLKENSARIKEIQASRISSCKRTYRGIKEVFDPFIPANPTNPRQIDLIEKFHTNIDRLIQGCIKQTKPKARVSSKSKSKPKPEGDG